MTSVAHDREFCILERSVAAFHVCKEAGGGSGGRKGEGLWNDKLFFLLGMGFFLDL